MSEDRRKPDTPSESAPRQAERAPRRDESADRLTFGDVSGHLAFQREIAAMLADADITEEQRQQFLIAASCPCCGAGGLSLSLSLKPGSTPGF